MHTRVAGSGIQLPFNVHTAIVFLTGTNPGLHPNRISAPSVVFWYVPIMEPFPGTVGLLQLAGEKRKWHSYKIAYAPTNVLKNNQEST